ncbi:phospholipid-binding protein [Parafrankia colletiae]|uniref:Phospholipid-binding protein n=1 Tax=Parafrankia colletiae TaxID=573497 RepID=A0A1S1RM74_9ACTN|nr:phospholipid-binding protein [Parafrankia colletiae]MCK9899221.1 phospholipid-binding protein [Frankia sp. Cpl3]OHV45904.1 phospholipid-binding protein [Parafrankia colletiae]
MDDAPRGLRESLKRVAVTLKEAQIPFALGGSYACWARGGPEPVHDVDFMLRETDVPRAVDVLCDAGLRPVDPPEDWLTKVYDGDVLVDLIHHPVGRAVTDEMLARSRDMSVDSVRMPVLDATDWFEMTLLALDERYCDLGRVIPMIRAMREQVDWTQVRRATAESPFAEAALLVATRLQLIPAPAGLSPAGPPFAGPPSAGPPSAGPSSVGLPSSGRGSAGEAVTTPPAGSGAVTGAPESASDSAFGSDSGLATAGQLDVTEPAEYLAGELRERLAEDPRVAELGLEVAVASDAVIVRGEVALETRRTAVDIVLAEIVPDRPIRNQVTVSQQEFPPTVESVS